MKQFLYVAPALSLLVAGCSQVVSNPAKGEMDEDGFYYTDAGWEFSEWEAPVFYRADFFDSLKTLPPPKQNTMPFTNVNMVYLNKISELTYEGHFFINFGDEVHNVLLSFDKTSGEPPLLAPLFFYIDEDDELGLESRQLVEPIEYKERLYYPLDTSILDMEDTWHHFQLYNRDGTPYPDSIKNVTATDKVWETYPLDFYINIIVAGKYAGTSDGASIEELAKKIQDRINKALNPGGVSVKGVNILYAEDNPLVGDNFNSAEKVVLERYAPKNAIDSLALWPGHEGEINFILGYYIDEDNDDGTMTGGFSDCPGNIYNDETQDYATSIAIVTHGIYNNRKETFSSTQIANTAVHELGHFFGLEHTTEYGGTLFDNYTDTPECSEMESPSFNINKCPDIHYLMFPRGTLDWQYTTFTPQQMDVIRMYLTMNRHK